MKQLVALLAMPLALISQPNSYYQVNTYEALHVNVNQGFMPIDSLTPHGDFGIGNLGDKQNVFTLYDGKYYLTQDDGTIVPLSANDRAAFAQITQFQPIKHFDIGAAMHYPKVNSELQPHIENRNVPYSIVITGTFNYLKLAARNSANDPKTFEERNISGSLVGFWIPDTLHRLSQSGFHFHFISQDRTKGGHVLDVGIARGICALAPLYLYEVEFPQTKEFAAARFSKEGPNAP